MLFSYQLHISAYLEIWFSVRFCVRHVSILLNLRCESDRCDEEDLFCSYCPSAGFLTLANRKKKQKGGLEGKAADFSWRQLGSA